MLRLVTRAVAPIAAPFRSTAVAVPPPRPLLACCCARLLHSAPTPLLQANPPPSNESSPPPPNSQPVRNDSEYGRVDAHLSSDLSPAERAMLARRRAEAARADAAFRAEQAFEGHKLVDHSGMTLQEHATTDSRALPGDIPRTGDFPTNPYRQLTEAELNCTDGASCPSYPWDHSPHAHNNERMQLLRNLPYPHPLPPVYTHSPGYRPSPELRNPGQRLIHVLAVVLCTTIPLWIFMGPESATGGSNAPQQKRQLAIQTWSQQRIAELRRTPAEMRAFQLRKLGFSEDELPEARKAKQAEQRGRAIA